MDVDGGDILIATMDSVILEKQETLYQLVSGI